MHIMVNKGYMWKDNTCVGHKARMNKLLLKKPPGIVSADSASVACKQGTNGPLKAVREKEKEKNIRQIVYKKWTEEGDEHRVRH